MFNGYEFDIEQLRHQLIQDRRKQEIEEENLKKKSMNSNQSMSTVAAFNDNISPNKNYAKLTDEQID